MSSSPSVVDPGGLDEFSVVFTDRSLNHMAQNFQQVMRDIASGLREVYHADGVAVIPGGGTYAMEAVARQFATDRRVLVIRNGWFSYRWSQILEVGRIASEIEVHKAAPVEEGPLQPFAPADIDEVVARIHAFRPEVVFAPHVETSAGIMLPDGYLQALAEAAHAVDALFVLDCIASGTIWVDMQTIGVDVLISAPQKGWSASPCAGLVMLSSRAETRLAATESSSFACDLKKWHATMQIYEAGGHAYHATLPTDALRRFRDAMHETFSFGIDRARDAQLVLGQAVRALLADMGFASVAAPGFAAPGVVVCYTDDPALHNGSRLAAEGVQIAAGVPLACDEPADFRTFRIGLFGLDKLADVPATVARLESAFTRALENNQA
ncbi:MAG: alanine--glyoxylate aminotransferase family protein [Gammaproteobacteria bacterium]|nr:alanine--glyoxylate aminotransferase family protein [Gammaproteobacteria bacterium]